MSFVVAAPDLVQDAAQDLAGIRASLADASTAFAGPTTGVLPAAADEVSTAIAAMFGDFGREFQMLNAQAQAFHAEFVSLMNAGAGEYVGTETANAEEALANSVGAPMQTLFGSVASAGLGGGETVPAALGGGLLGGALGGGTTTGVPGVTGTVGSLLGGTGSLGGTLNSVIGGQADRATWVRSTGELIRFSRGSAWQVGCPDLRSR